MEKTVSTHGGSTSDCLRVVRDREGEGGHGRKHIPSEVKSQAVLGTPGLGRLEIPRNPLGNSL
jgi:hypothetical protein